MGLETSGKGSQDYVGADSWCCMVECEGFVLVGFLSYFRTDTAG